MTARGEYRQTVVKQPELLAESARQVRTQLGDLDPSPWREKALGLVGMGASTHAAHMLTWVAGNQGVRAKNIDASSLMSVEGSNDLADAYIVTSESGESAETVYAAQRLFNRSVLGLTNVPGSSLSQNVGTQVVLGCGVDSGVYTIGYTATVQAFALIAEWLNVKGIDVDIHGLPDMAEKVLDATESKAEYIGNEMAFYRSVDVVGHGAHYGAAAETALLLREAARMPAAAYDTYQYLHGPMESVGKDTVCIIFGSGRELSLSTYLESATAANTLLITDDCSAEEKSRLRVINVPSLGAAAMSIVEILPAQHVVGAIARRKGLAIGGFQFHQQDTKLSDEY